MKIFRPDNIRIINEIGRWGIISLQDLFKIFGKGKTYSNFRKKIRDLEKDGYLISIVEQEKSKYLGLSETGSMLSIYPRDERVHSNNIHSIIKAHFASRAIRSLLTFELFYSGSVTERLNFDPLPDGVIFAKRYGKKYTLAIEVELYPQTESNFTKKLVKFVESENGVNHILYITKDKFIFYTYKKFISDTRDEFADMAILSFDKSLSISGYDYLNSICWMRDESSNFQKIFGEERK